jgi:hypothetical protein
MALHNLIFFGPPILMGTCVQKLPIIGFFHLPISKMVLLFAHQGVFFSPYFISNVIRICMVPGVKLFNFSFPPFSSIPDRTTYDDFIPINLIISLPLLFIPYRVP